MIRSYFGLTETPFALREIKLLAAQQEIYDTLKVHCQQGGLCMVVGRPGTGKSVIKESLKQLPEKEHLVATVARTLHTYTNTVKILCEAFRIEFESSAFQCERRLIEQAFNLNHTGKMLITIIDDAHLMEMDNLRKLRLLFEDFPKNHNLILIGQPVLLTHLDLAVNQDLKSRVTYSVITKRLHPDSMREFIHRELERLGLPHSTFTTAATELIIRSADGVLRKCRNLCLSTMLEAVRASAGREIDIDLVLRTCLWSYFGSVSYRIVVLFGGFCYTLNSVCLEPRSPPPLSSTYTPPFMRKSCFSSPRSLSWNFLGRGYKSWVNVFAALKRKSIRYSPS